MLVVLSEGLQEDIRYPIDSGLIEVLGSYYRDTTFGMFTIFTQGLCSYPYHLSQTVANQPAEFARSSVQLADLVAWRL